MTTHAADDGYSPGAGTKGRRLAPSEVFEVGDLLSEIYSQRATDSRWQGHVSIIQRGSRRRLEDGVCCLHKPTARKRRLTAGSRPPTEMVRANRERRHP